MRVVDLPGRPVPWGGALALSPDGRRLLYPQLDGIASDIMLVENFRGPRRSAWLDARLSEVARALLDLFLPFGVN